MRISTLLLSLLLASARGAAAPIGDVEVEALGRQLARLARPSSLVGFEPRSPQGARGLGHILAGRALPFRVPLDVLRLLQGDRTPEELWRQEGAVPSPFFQDPSMTLGVGDVVTRDQHGIRLLTRGCLTCHAGPVAGKLVAGLPNAHLDLVPSTALAESLPRLEAFRSLPDPEAAPLPQGPLQQYYRYLRDYKAYTDQVLLPAYRHSRARGDNTGAYGAWFMIARIRDPERSGIVPGAAAPVDTTSLPTVDPAPWWTIRFKAAAYRFWDAPGHSPLAFNYNFYIPEKHIDSPATLEAHRRKLATRAGIVADVLHFARETQPPPLPEAAQVRLRAAPEELARGEDIFHGGPTRAAGRQSCFRCHGTYRAQGDALVVKYPNRGLVSVGTDPTYNRVLRHFAPLTERLNRTRTFYGEALAPFSQPVTRPGYVPPVLVGVWASAPYLHNGAVPTLASLLDPPAARPVLWGRPVSPDAYDLERVGLAHDELTRDEFEELARGARGRPPRHPAAVAYRRVVDTTETGRSNQGHRFGTTLDPDEKQALLSFLLSLAPLEGRERVVAAP